MSSFLFYNDSQFLDSSSFLLESFENKADQFVMDYQQMEPERETLVCGNGWVRTYEGSTLIWHCIPSLGQCKPSYGHQISELNT